jgi:hypothetical protein
MPLINETTWGSSYPLAISTASLMAAEFGISGIYRISYMATRIMAAASLENARKIPAHGVTGNVAVQLGGMFGYHPSPAWQ